MRRQIRYLLLPTLPCIMVALFVGCFTGPRTFVHPEADMAYYTKIAVLPFENLTKDRFAGEKVAQCLITELLITKRFDIVDPGELSRALNAVGVNIKHTNGGIEVDMSTAKRLANELNVRGIVMGSVREYEMMRVGQEQYPLISISVRLVDAQAGKVVWMSSHSRRGGPGLPIFGFGEVHTLSRLAQEVCQDVVASLIKKAY